MRSVQFWMFMFKDIDFWKQSSLFRLFWWCFHQPVHPAACPRWKWPPWNVQAANRLNGRCQRKVLQVTRVFFELHGHRLFGNWCIFSAWTPLHCSALGGHVEVCRLLLQSKADASARSRCDLITLVHCSMFSNDLLRFSDGRTALDFATDSNHVDVIAYLSSIEPPQWALRSSSLILVWNKC